MPSGKTHDFLTLLFVPVIGIFTYLFYKKIMVILVMVFLFIGNLHSYLASGKFIHSLNVNFNNSFGSSLIMTVVVVVGFLFGGLMFSGDLDIKSKVYKRWGIFRFIWIPYRKFVPHRSLLSHGIVTGMLFRLAYFTFVIFLFFLVIFFVLQFLGGISSMFKPLSLKPEDYKAFDFLYKQAPLYIGGFLVGVWAGAALHTISDITWSFLKRLR